MDLNQTVLFCSYSHKLAEMFCKPPFKFEESELEHFLIKEI